MSVRRQIVLYEDLIRSHFSIKSILIVCYSSIYHIFLKTKLRYTYDLKEIYSIYKITIFVRLISTFPRSCEVYGH